MTNQIKSVNIEQFIGPTQEVTDPAQIQLLESIELLGSIQTVTTIAVMVAVAWLVVMVLGKVTRLRKGAVL